MKHATIGSLFSGVGGLELGLEWAGLGPVIWQVEKDEFCRRVLAKHWPDVERYEDIRAIRASQLRAVDIICGGFPCQDVSSAGQRKGLKGPSSGLWWDFVRIVDGARPRFVVVENVASGASRWLCAVRTHLHQLGYRTRALGVAAAEVGAPHIRRRVFVVADADGIASRRAARPTRDPDAPDADGDVVREQPRRRGGPPRGGEAVARDDGAARGAADAARDAHAVGSAAREDLRGSWNGGRDGGAPVSAVRRMDDGFSRRMDAA